jgi:hypothetical protein
MTPLSIHQLACIPRGVILLLGAPILIFNYRNSTILEPLSMASTIAVTCRVNIASSCRLQL